MNIGLSKHAKTALNGLEHLRQQAKVSSAPTRDTPYVATQQKAQAKSRWRARLGRARAIADSRPAHAAYGGAIALGLALWLAVQPALDARDEYRAALHREQGANQLRATQDAKLIKHHAEGAITLRIVARKDDPKALQAVTAALTILGGK